jgi:hypothetical protein
VLLLSLVCTGSAFAQDGGVSETDAGVGQTDASTATPDAGAPSFLFYGLESNKPAAELSSGLGQSFAQRLAADGLTIETQEDVVRILGLERQKELSGNCSEGSNCMLELGNAMAVGFAINGRVDRYGDRYVFNVNLLDMKANAPVMKVRREVEGASDLPEAVDSAADEIALHFGYGPKSKPFFSPVSLYGFNLALGLGSELITSIAQLAPQVDLELGYRITRTWAIFLKISTLVTFGSASMPDTSATIVPGLIGLRYYFRDNKSIQPTLSTALGIKSTVSSIQGKGTRPSLVLGGGLWWFIVEPIGVGLEASVDVLGLAFGFADTNKTGIDVGFSLAVMYRF